MTISSPQNQVPLLKTALPGPRAAEWIARDMKVISTSYTRGYPLVAARGSGCTLEDVDGNLFLDFTAGIAVNATGHSHPDVVAAIADQAAKLIHMSGTDFYYAPEIELAERLVQLTPGDHAKRVFFANSGAETIEAALKLARHHSGRQRVISCYGAFHGRTYGALSLGGSKALHQHGFGPVLSGVHRIHFDSPRAELEELFATVCPADEVAARAVVYAAEYPLRKQYWVGASTAATILANRVAPALLDRYLARTGYGSQQTSEPADPDRPDNLLQPVDGVNGHDFGPHGAFDGRSHDHSPQAWLSRHAGVTSAFIGSAAVLGGFLAGKLGQRR